MFLYTGTVVCNSGLPVQLSFFQIFSHSNTAVDSFRLMSQRKLPLLLCGLVNAIAMLVGCGRVCCSIFTTGVLFGCRRRRLSATEIVLTA